MIFYKIKGYSGYGLEQSPRTARDVSAEAGTLGQGEVIILADDSVADEVTTKTQPAMAGASPAGNGSSLATIGRNAGMYTEGEGTEGAADMVQVTEDDLTEKWWNWKSFAIGVGSGIGFAGLIWILSRAAKKGKRR